MGTDLRGRPLDMSIWGSWRGECRERGKRTEDGNIPKRSFGMDGGKHSSGGISLKYMAL